MKKILLPVDNYLEKILSEIQKNSCLIISAPPGSGKTTRVAPSLINLSSKKIVMLQPRRLAAISSAQRIAEENEWTLGKEVGYQVRFDNKTNRDTKINIITEALLIKKMVSDPDLSDTDLVIIDEFHERSLSTDLAIACIKELQELSRPDLKLIVMSATIDKLKLSDFLGGAPIVNIEIPTYPLEVIFSKKQITYKINSDFYIRIRDTLQQALKTCEGHILVFLPGMKEIRESLQICTQSIQSSGIDFFSLHGSMSIEEQKTAITPSEKRKIIFTTNIAETSLTINGVDCVIDSGLVRKASYDVQAQSHKITLGKISKASSIQRAGRSHRQKKGFCFKLWTEQDEASMNEFNLPEIATSDLSETILFLIAIGITDIEKFSWFEQPESRRVKHGYENIQKFNCVKGVKITDKGYQVLLLPMDVPLGSLFYDFVFCGEAELGAHIITFLNEPNSFKSQTINEFITDEFSREKWNWSSKKNYEQILSFAKKIKLQEPLDFSYQNLSLTEKSQIILLKSIYFYLGKMRELDQKIALLYNGKGATLKHINKMEEEYFIALSYTQVENQNELRVNQPLFLPKRVIETHLSSEIKKTMKINLDTTKNKFYKYEEVSVGKIILHLGQKQIAEESDIQDQLAQVIFSQWESIIFKNEILKNWVNRICYYKKITQTESSAEIYTQDKILSAIEMAAAGESDLNKIFDKDWIYFLELQESPSFNSMLSEKYPLKISLNSSKIYIIQYNEDLPPTISAKIQEFYGFKDHIYVGDKIPVTLELLAPNYRPTQITNNITSFWKTSYPQIKKELKGRYPKHEWPEDPENWISLKK